MGLIGNKNSLRKRFRAKKKCDKLLFKQKNNNTNIFITVIA